MTEPMAGTDACEHHFETRILGGHPLTVRACTLCRKPDWADLHEQAVELYRWGWQEGRDGKAARETLSAYDKPREVQDGPHAPQDGPQHPDAGAETPDGTGGRQTDVGGREADQLRADANAWRHKAIRRSLTISKLRGTIDACTDLADEEITDRTGWGDGYRAAIADLREVLREFGQIDQAATVGSGGWLRAGTRDLSIPETTEEQP